MLIPPNSVCVCVCMCVCQSAFFSFHLHSQLVLLGQSSFDKVDTGCLLSVGVAAALTYTLPSMYKEHLKEQCGQGLKTTTDKITALSNSKSS